jgi:hypothetical protein
VSEKWISVGRQEGFKMYSNGEIIIEVGFKSLLAHILSVNLHSFL